MECVIEKKINSDGSIEISEFVLNRRYKQLIKGRTERKCVECDKNIKYYNYHHHKKTQKHILNEKLYNLLKETL